MGRRMIERKLRQISARLRETRSELALVDEQLEQFTDDESDAALRALVSETPFADAEHREAAGHAEAMRKHRAHLLATIDELDRRQDELLDQLAAHL
jgi:chromosome segregation ATPase